MAIPSPPLQLPTLVRGRYASWLQPANPPNRGFVPGVLGVRRSAILPPFWWDMEGGLDGRFLDALGISEVPPFRSKRGLTITSGRRCRVCPLIYRGFRAARKGHHDATNAH